MQVIPFLKRWDDRQQTVSFVKLLRNCVEKIPNIILRTTLISGFPGETEDDHRETLKFVNEMEFDRLGVFTYSAEENTPAATHA